MPRSDTGLEVEGQGRDLSGAPCSNNLPRFAHNFTMGRVLLAGDRFRIASEGQAKEKKGREYCASWFFVERWRPPAPGFLLRKK
jgi:hypothetical protein